MKTPDEIKRGLECCSEDGCKVCPYEQDCNMADGFSVLAADALTYIQQLEDHLRENTKMVERLESQVPKWISVEERLPEKHADGSVSAVLVTDGYLIHMAYFYDDSWFFCECGEIKEPWNYNITHWMPLPEPPEEENK